MTTPRLTKAQRIARDKLNEYLWHASNEAEITVALRQEVPEAWYRLEKDLDVAEKKVKVTLMLDESVAKFFRGMGAGYQARINRILGTWAQMKIMGALEWEAKLDEILSEGVRAKQADGKLRRAAEEG
ncbi:BrnA antitoxin family protein [Litoreibacter roseus]|uniref:BrnA antitoxin of type II toxin-antitoxin system n=1 Tax=Litoreibacter roseus TaxID=2601869 RepID=A0A6N6JC73_9RHOB|nr:BrnA antitoxin family protein [Litoreibacter roseus]GFE62999.1 hypothetical protein KIN_00730 [Litoreibacter roseus]